jgi:tyrosyl-tRNA synthetase
MYQFLLNQSDEMIETLLKRLTYLSKDEIKEIMKNHKKEPSKRVAQKELANNIVRDVHGENELKKALKITDAFFNNKLENLESDELLEGLGDKNNFLSPHGKINILDLLLETKMVKSKGEGRKIIEQKGISINGKIIESIDFNVEKKDSINNSFSYIKKGKKEYCLVKFK